MSKINPNNKYTTMQKNFYNEVATLWSEQSPDYVVGTFHQHNNWLDYENLFTGIKNLKEKTCLDFACGPGRNLVKYNNRFKRIDGVDISSINIDKAKQYLINNNIKNTNLYVANGIDLDIIPSNTYDVVMSTIALQHICVYDIRYSIFKDIYRVLNRGGVLTAQMGYGSPSPNTVGYYSNYYDAKGTNRACDVCVASYDQIEKDLLAIGFVNFKYTIGPVGPGDCHPNWIYFQGTKA